MKTLKLLFVFLCFQLVSPAQVPPSVYVPVNLAYNSSKSGTAILKNGKTLNGKFYYRNHCFSSKVSIYYYVNGEQSKLEKIPIADFTEITMVGKKSGKSYLFKLQNNKLSYVGEPNSKIRSLNRKTFKKIK